MKNLLYISMALLLFVSCTEKPSLNDTFYGITPCADCPGILYELELKEDFTFSEKSTYLDREAEVKNLGTYTIEEDLLILESEEGIKKLRIKGDELLLLDADDNEVTGELTEYYKLNKEQPNLNLFYDAVTEYSFKAHGVEPFWSAKIGTDKKLYLSTLFDDGEQLHVLNLPEARSISEHAQSYMIETDKLQLELMLRPETCQDGMADDKFTHQVDLRLKTEDWTNFRELRGCGAYNGNYRLQNTWSLVSIDGKQISETNRGAHLVFDVDNQTFYVNGGCNNINGVASISNTTVGFKNTVSTLMACENLDEEQLFISKLEGQTFEIHIDHGKLLLKNDISQLQFDILE